MSADRLNIDMFLYSYFPMDIRPRKEAMSLLREGHKLRIYCLRHGSEMEHEVLSESLEVFRVLELTIPERNSMLRILFFWFLILKRWERRPGRTVLHCHDLTALPPGFVLALLHNVFLVYDAHELFPESARERAGLLGYSMFFAIEVICCIRVNYLVGVTNAQLRILSKRCGAPHIAINNYPSLDEISFRYHDISEPVILGLSGIVIRNRGHLKVFEALALLHGRIDFVLWVVGAGPEMESIRNDAKRTGIPCRFFGHIDRTEDMWDTIAMFDYAIIANQPTTNYLITSVNRPYEYAALGVPFISPHFHGIIDIISALGLPNFDSQSPKSIATAIEKIIQYPRKELSYLGRKLVEEQFHWTIVEERLVNLYANLAMN